MATIGIDLTPIQGPHRMRGVGATVINVLRHLSSAEKSEHEFVFYLYEANQAEALDLIDASSFGNYETRRVAEQTSSLPSVKSVHGLLFLPLRLSEAFKDRWQGTHRITDTKGLDVFLQFEQDVIPPRGVKSVVVAYDLIPYILESDYLWSYSTARHLHRYSRRGAFLVHLRRMRYIRTIRATAKRASKLLAISKQTKNDFMKYANIPSSKLDVVYLGISDDQPSKSAAKPAEVTRYIGTGWGDIKVKTTLPDSPFLLFVGGVDPRRKLTDLIAAFNMLRAQGHTIHLVLAGDTMTGPHSIPNGDIKKALLSSSYLDDIYMLGFVDDATREWLYQNALAFVYPSIYEGFGLPILEAMRYGTPVITYKNSSISEISGVGAHYALGYGDITNITKALVQDKVSLKIHAKKNIEHANNFTWEKTASNYFKLLID